MTKGELVMTDRLSPATFQFTGIGAEERSPAPVRPQVASGERLAPSDVTGPSHAGPETWTPRKELPSETALPSSTPWLLSLSARVASRIVIGAPADVTTVPAVA